MTVSLILRLSLSPTYVHCRHLQISPLWTPSRTLLFLILYTFFWPLLMLTTSVPGPWPELAPAIDNHNCIFLKKKINFCPFIYLFLKLFNYLLLNKGECPAWDLVSRWHPPLLGDFVLSTCLQIVSVLLCVFLMLKWNEMKTLCIPRSVPNFYPLCQSKNSKISCYPGLRTSLILTEIIVDRTNWLWSSTNFKRRVQSCFVLCF